MGLLLDNLDMLVGKLLGKPLLETYYIYLFIHFLALDLFPDRGIEHESGGGKAIRIKAI